MNYDTEVLVIGGGAAACLAALEAAQNGRHTVVIDLGRIGRSGSTITSGGASSVVMPVELGGHPEDSNAVHYQDIMAGGGDLADGSMLSSYIEEGAGCVHYLESIGVEFRKDSAGNYQMIKSLGRSYPRLCSPVGGAVRQMEIIRQGLVNRGVKLIEGVRVTELIQVDGRVCGVVGCNVLTGEMVGITARSVVLATGGATDLYQNASANFRTSGTAYALALRAGAALVNMEFVEFTRIPCPDGVPVATGGISPLPGSGAVFYNRLGEAFMEQYDPLRRDRTARSVLVRAVWQEEQHGRGPVMMDASAVKGKREPGGMIYRKLRSRGVELYNELVPWVPAVHTFLGGIWVDEFGSAGIPGLYAAGESAGHGRIFGADRIGTAICACHWLGRRAGRAAAEFAATNELQAGANLHCAQLIQQAGLRAGNNGSWRPGQVKRQLQELASNYLNIQRDAAGITKLLNKLPDLQGQLAAASTATLDDLLDFWATGALLETAELVGRAALAREETRGQHGRSDFPEQNDQWLRWIAIKGEQLDLVALNTN